MQDKILVVDDDPGIRSTLSELLEELGYQAPTASDGLEAVGLLDSGPYLCVLTDIMMPNMTGLELIKKIKAHNVSTPVIVITGYASLEIAIDAMKSGASDFLSKPFKIKQIELILNKVKREKQILEENKRFADELQLHRLIDNLVGQIEDKSQEITSLQAISERITNLKGIRDLVAAVEDVTSELLDDSEVCFYPLNRKTEKLINPNGGPEQDLEDGLINGTVISRINPDSSGIHAYDITFPFMIEGQLFGALKVLSHRIFEDNEKDKIAYLLQRTAERMENIALYEGLYENILSTLKSMAMILDARDPHTSQHSTRVTSLSTTLGKHLDLTEDDMDILYIAASLHDIGKVGIPDSILLKTGKLTNEEFDVIKKHPDLGADIIKPITPMLKETYIIRHHHERYDGKGYPAGLIGEEIPLLSRIIALADAFDAMTSDRPYRKGLSFDKAYQEILRCKGTQFDPDITDVFLEHISEM